MRRRGHASTWRARRLSALLAAGVALASILGGCADDAEGQSAPEDLVLPVAFGLPRDLAGLSGAALARSTPGDPDYGRWLTAAQIADFGASQADAQRALDLLAGAGFEGSIDPTGGLIVGSMTAGEAEELLGVRIVMTGGDDIAVVRPASAPRVPRVLQGLVTQIVGLTLAVPGSSNSATATGEPPGGSASAPAATPPCPPPVPLSLQLDDAYGLTPLHAAGRGGEGVTIGMLQIDQTSQRALSLFEECFDVAIAPVTTVPVDSSDPRVFGLTAEESTLDIVAASLLAPNLEGIRTYQFNPRSSLLFPLSAAVSDSLRGGGPQVISTSIGACDQSLRREAIDLTEWVLASAAAAGVTVVASAGDTGSSGCAPASTAEASQYPASSPFILAVGGTEFEQSGGARREQVWNDSPALVQAGGGSRVSSLPRPRYQDGIAWAQDRVVPDVAFVAAPATFGPIPVCTDAGQCEHKVVGGTSATAPGLAAAISELMDALAPTGAEPRQLGLLNPSIYALAGDPGTAAMFRDITVGDNDLYGVGCCTATPGFDAASGWGSIDFGALLRYLQARPTSR